MALINCPECGHTMSNHAEKCPNCGLPQSLFYGSATTPNAAHQPSDHQQPQQSQMQQHPQQYQMQQQQYHGYNYNSLGQQSNPNLVKPSNHQLLAIMALIFGGLIFGIVSLVYSSKVDTLWAQGSYSESVKASDSARIWAVLGIALNIIGFFVMIILAATL